MQQQHPNLLISDTGGTQGATRRGGDWNKRRGVTRIVSDQHTQTHVHVLVSWVSVCTDRGWVMGVSSL